MNSKETMTKSYYAHPNALVETGRIGKRTRIWAFAHILKEAVIGEDCNIGDHSFIEGGAQIGNKVVVKNGVSIWDGVTIENRVFIGPNAAFINDRVPRAGVYHEKYEKTLIKKGASVGANATLLCGITLGRWCVVGAGSVVTSDVPDYGLVYGNPARLEGWVCRCGKRLDLPIKGGTGKAKCECGLRYVKDDSEIRGLNPRLNMKDRGIQRGKNSGIKAQELGEETK